MVEKYRELSAAQEQVREQREGKEKIDHKRRERQLFLAKTKLEIWELKYLVETGVIDRQTFETIVEDQKITNEEFQEVLKKVDIQKLFEKLEEIKKADDTIPQEYQVHKEEYLQAFQNAQTREEVLQKFDASLDLIYHHIHGGSTSHGNMFGTYVSLLHQKLIPLQENIIDVKTPLSTLPA